MRIHLFLIVIGFASCLTRPLAACRAGAIAYEEIFGMPLIKVVKSETFGWYEKTLCYIIREAFEERVHIPRKHIHLVRDVDI